MKRLVITYSILFAAFIAVTTFWDRFPAFERTVFMADWPVWALVLLALGSLWAIVAAARERAFGLMVAMVFAVWEVVPNVRHFHQGRGLVHSLSFLIPIVAGFGASLLEGRFRRWQQAALKRGDYRQALERVVLLPSATPDGTESERRCMILILAGRLDEAETMLREMHERGSYSARRAALALLGQVLLLKGEFAQARDCLNDALFCGEHRANVYLAELACEEGIASDEALDWIDEISRRRLRPENWLRISPARLAADRAWLYALFGMSREVEPALAEAIAHVDHTDVPGYAEFLYRSGRARLANDTPVLGLKDLETAARIDPHGLWGTRAAAFAAQPAYARA